MMHLGTLLSKLSGLSLKMRGPKPDVFARAGFMSQPTPSAKTSPFRNRPKKRAAIQNTSLPSAEPSATTQQRAKPREMAQAEWTASALDKLSIPCPDPTLEDRIRDSHQNEALRLVRQEDWDKLISRIEAADRDNEMTHGGMTVAELMAFGARADVVLAVEHALLDRVPAEDAPMLSGIEALEHILAENADSYVIACIVAQAHMDMAWSWRGIGWDVEVAPRNREAFDAHFARAHEIIEPLNGEPVQSALLANTSCALLHGGKCTSRSVADRYQALIDLNPHNTGPLRALGTHMLPRSYGSYAGLELEARRTAARTQSVWGAGGYTWVMFDAISVDDEACARLDLPFFMEGLRDIVERRPEPHTINLLAAYCSNTMGQAFSGNDAADHMRAQIAGCANWIVREHLTELHPMIWAHASQGFVNNLRVASAHRFAASGQDDALRIIASLFKPEISEGKRITFTDDGPVATAG
ncbi:hypothetical protein [Sulfitobacter sp.]|uniref:hypothetical protein n=1 Tax=Sulfitobacter sp. TaxID=1903071 RepID=UPI003002E843